jgi:holo-[acyl-carrier protein] synthase
MAVVGIGVDLVDVARFERALERTPALKDRLFGAHDLARPLPVHSLAARFAAKEASLKALGGHIRGFSWHDIQVSGEHNQPPHLVFSGGVAQAVQEQGITNHQVSLSHDAGLAIAFVMMEGETTS